MKRFSTTHGLIPDDERGNLVYYADHLKVLSALEAENQAAWEAVTKFCEASCVQAISSHVLAARSIPDSN